MNGKVKESIRPRIKPERIPIPFLLIKPLMSPCEVVLARAGDYTMRSSSMANVAPRGGFCWWFLVFGLWFLVHKPVANQKPKTKNHKPETRNQKPETDSDGRKAKPRPSNQRNH